jgi:hypothetical protein
MHRRWGLCRSRCIQPCRLVQHSTDWTSLAPCCELWYLWSSFLEVVRRVCGPTYVRRTWRVVRVRPRGAFLGSFWSSAAFSRHGLRYIASCFRGGLLYGVSGALAPLYADERETRAMNHGNELENVLFSKYSKFIRLYIYLLGFAMRWAADGVHNRWLCTHFLSMYHWRPFFYQHRRSCVDFNGLGLQTFVSNEHCIMALSRWFAFVA